jgi:uncharacterized protein (DUF2141 family)
LLGATDVPRGVHVQVEVTDLRSDAGVVRACMTSDADRFPKCRDDSVSYRVVAQAEDALVLDFGIVSPGRYAIALLHDENRNGKADRAAGMIPREGFGFSRDAKVRMGPPSFDSAAFEVGHTSVRKTIRMRYML